MQQFSYRSVSTQTSAIFITTIFSNNDLFEYFIQEVNLPGFSFTHSEPLKGRIHGLQQGGIVTFEEMTLTMLIDEKMEVVKQIYEKANMYNNPETNTQNFDLGGDSVLILNDAEGKAILKFRFKGCKLKSAGAIQYTNTTTSDDQLTIPVQIQFDYFTMDTADGN